MKKNLTTEERLLGAMLISKSVAEYALGRLTDDSFGTLSCRTIFRAMRSVAKKKRDINLTTVISELYAAKKMETVGGEDYLKSLTQQDWLSINVPYLCSNLNPKTNE